MFAVFRYQRTRISLRVPHVHLVQSGILRRLDVMYVLMAMPVPVETLLNVLYVMQDQQPQRVYSILIGATGQQIPTSHVKGIAPNPSMGEMSHNDDCSGWRLLGDRIDSGLNYGRFQYTTFELDIAMSIDGYVTFNYSIECADICIFGFNAHAGNEYYGYTTLTNRTRSVTIPLRQGNNTLWWRFTTYLFNDSDRLLPKICQSSFWDR